MVKKKQAEKVGRINIQDIQKKLNEKSKDGMKAFVLKQDENPTKVDEWIPTGAVWLDNIIAKGMKAGIPVARVSELAGLESSGKSYLAACICANAQKQGIIPVYFDSESAIDPEFWEKLDIDTSSIIYIPAESVEFVFEKIKFLMKEFEGQTRFLFVIDSFANTPTIASMESEDVDPNATVSKKARVASEAIQQITTPLSKGKHTLLVLNQLRTRIGTTESGATIGKYTPSEERYFTPGGKALHYVYSLRIWLTRGNAKKEFITNENGFRIGAEVKAKLKKCRFGTEGRECRFKIVWGDDNQLGIKNIDSIWEAIQTSEKLKGSGAWKEIEGYNKKFQPATFEKLFKEDEKFRELINNIFEEETIHKFRDKRGDAQKFYSLEEGDLFHSSSKLALDISLPLCDNDDKQ